jgi:predicted PurR-regulated permease PerM
MRDDDPKQRVVTGSDSTFLELPARYAIVLLGIYLSYLILRPFFAALAWAVIFAILFHRMQVQLAPRLGPNRAALATTVVVAIAIVTPAVLLISTVAREAPQAAAYLTDASRSAPRQLQEAWDAMRARIPVSLPADPMELVNTGVQRAAAILGPRAGTFVAGFFALLGDVGAMLFALFFMARDGEAISQYLRHRLPFSERDSERLMGETRDMVIASVGAGLIVAATQGVIGGVAFWLLGIPAAAFWGLVMGICSLLPVVGATLVWVPASIWLLLSGDVGRGLILVLVGTFGISLVDNVLRPLLLSGRTRISGLIIFFGLLGGAAAFGFTGLVIGPIILVMTARIVETLRHPEPAQDSPLL